MTRPGLWSAIACHSGYMGFELAYLPDLVVAATEVARHRTVEAFLAHVSALERPSDREIVALAVVAMAATYDPDPGEPAKIRLPIDSETAEPIPERWERWLAHDPVRLAATHVDALRSLKLLYFDCGNAILIICISGPAASSDCSMHSEFRPFTRSSTAATTPSTFASIVACPSSSGLCAGAREY